MLPDELFPRPPIRSRVRPTSPELFWRIFLTPLLSPAYPPPLLDFSPTPSPTTAKTEARRGIAASCELSLFFTLQPLLRHVLFQFSCRGVAMRLSLRRYIGFTLIELLVVIAIIAVL